MQMSVVIEIRRKDKEAMIDFAGLKRNNVRNSSQNVFNVRRVGNYHAAGGIVSSTRDMFFARASSSTTRPRVFNML